MSSADTPLATATAAILRRFGEGATSPEELPELRAFVDELSAALPLSVLDERIRRLSHAGYLRGAVVAVADHLARHPRLDLALRLASELLDALDPELGVELARAILAVPDPTRGQLDERASAPQLRALAVRSELEISTNLMLGEHLLEHGDVDGALRHFEAVLALDVDHSRALRGWSTCARELERRGRSTEHRSRGLSLLDGLEALELAGGVGLERYELGRPLGRGRHAVVYEAYDRRVGRSVAIKRLLGDDARRDGVPARIVESRFFAEAETLARVRSPHVVALLDVQPRHRFVALELCRGGNLRLAMRRRLLTPADLGSVSAQLRLALSAVHATGAVHRDVKPANILVREARAGSPVALADFGLAIGNEARAGSPAPSPGRTGPGRSDPRANRARTAVRAGTLRYLAPEIKAGTKATPASDLYAAGVVLLELAAAPKLLPPDFDRLDASFDARASIAELLAPGTYDPGAASSTADTAGVDDRLARWGPLLERLLSPDPEQRTW